MSSPWIDKEEWFSVGQKLLSENVEDIKDGIDMVQCWEIRRSIPIAVAATRDLVKGKLERKKEILALAVVRLVNGLADRLQVGLFIIEAAL